MKTFFYTVIIISLLASPCYAGPQAKKQIKKGNVLYNNGEFSEALERYEEALLDAPDSDIVNFNLGTALYKVEDFTRATEHFQRSLVSDNESIEQKASYNLGNAKYKFGISKEETDLPGAVELLKQSLRHYEHAMEFDSEDEDAKHNYEFVQKELKRLEEKLQQQKEEQQNQQEKKDEEEKEEDSQQQQGQQQQSQQDQSGDDSGEQQEPQQPEESDKEEGESQDSQSQKEKEEQKEGASQQGAEQSQQTGEMSEEEAAMLLEGYRNEEEPRGLYKGRIPTQGMPKVLKDW